MAPKLCTVITYHPSHPFVTIWNSLLIFCWIHVLFIVPFKTGFLPLQHTWIFSIVDLSSDVILFVHTLYMAPRIARHIEGELITDYSELRSRYYASEFYLDMFCSIPIDTLFEMYSHLISHDALIMELYVTLARLPKLFLFQRLASMMNYQAVKWSKYINPAYLHMSAQLLLIFMITHWVGCGWVLLANTFGFGTTKFLMAKAWEHAPVWDKYQYAIFWGLSKMTSSDTGTGAPENQPERTFAMLVSLAGIAVYASLISSLSNLILGMATETDRVQAKIEKLHNYLRKKNMPKELSDRVSNHMEYKLYHEQDQEEREIMAELPNKLRAEIILWMHKSFIAAVPFLKNCSETLVRQLILKLKRTVFAPNEFVFHAGDPGDSMYFISKGQVEVRSTPNGPPLARIGTGSFFGEMDLLQNRGRVAFVKTLTFCDMLELRKRDLFEVAESDEDFIRQLREYSKVWMTPGDKKEASRLPSLVSLPKLRDPMKSYRSDSEDEQSPRKQEPSPVTINDQNEAELDESDEESVYEAFTDESDILGVKSDRDSLALSTDKVDDVSQIHDPLSRDVKQFVTEDPESENEKLRREVEELTRSLHTLINDLSIQSHDTSLISEIVNEPLPVATKVEEVKEEEKKSDSTPELSVFESNWNSPSIVALKFLIKLSSAARRNSTSHPENPKREHVQNALQDLHEEIKEVPTVVTSKIGKRLTKRYIRTPKHGSMPASPIAADLERDIQLSVESPSSAPESVPNTGEELSTAISAIKKGKKVKKYIRAKGETSIEKKELAPNTLEQTQTSLSEIVTSNSSNPQSCINETPKKGKRSTKKYFKNKPSESQKINLSETERFLIDNAILYADTSSISSRTPESVMVIYKALVHYDIKQNSAFASGVVNSLNLVTKIASTIDDTRTMVFWCKGSFLMAILLRQHCSNSILMNMTRVTREYQISPITDKRRDRSQIRFESEENVFVTTMDALVTEICRVCCKSYLWLLESAISKLDTLLNDAIFSAHDDNIQPDDTNIQMQQLLSMLDEYISLMKDSSIGSCVVRHFLTAISQYIDATIFNRLLHESTTKAAKAKSSISKIEVWFEKRGGFDKGELFKFSRQCSTALTIGKENLRGDEEMQDLVCPDLSADQVRHLLDIGIPMDTRQLTVNPVISISGALNPLFELDSDRVDKRAKISDKYLLKAGLEFLNK
jgi:CRP-like cAMP-binding protein